LHVAWSWHWDTKDKESIIPLCLTLVNFSSGSNDTQCFDFAIMLLGIIVAVKQPPLMEDDNNNMMILWMKKQQ